MTARLSPVTPEVLEWALNEDGRDLHLVAEQLDVDPDVLDAWANGDAQPTVGQVSDLAKVLKRPRALFFMPRPPEGASLPASFRHPPGDDERSVGQEARRQVRGARRVQQAVSWALREQPAVDLPRALMQTEAARAAQVARAWLGITSERQAAWKDEYQALREWRAALEERGVLVFSLEIGRGDVRGFSAWDDHAPLIVTNSTGMSPAVRCFTLMHELGHLMLRQDAACIEVSATGDGVAVERWCERFGAAVLMPTEDVTAWARERHLARGDADLDDVGALMRRFRVSGRAAALRLIDMKFAVQSLYASVVATFVPRPPKDDGKFYSPPRAVKRQRQYGERVLRTVLNDLPARDALSVLRMQVDDVRMLAENVPGIREI